MTDRKSRKWRQLSSLCALLLTAGMLAACASAQAPAPAPASSTTSAAAGETQSVQAAPAAAVASPASITEPTGPAPVSASTSALAPAAQVPASKAPAASLAPETRTSDGGGVTIQATPAATADGSVAISLALNTHSVELSYDYRALASLRDDLGHVYPATAWDGGNGGHHVTGKILFSSNPLQSGSDIKWVELEIKGVAGVPARTFRWNVE